MNHDFLDSPVVSGLSMCARWGHGGLHSGVAPATSLDALAVDTGRAVIGAIVSAGVVNVEQVERVDVARNISVRSKLDENQS